MGNDFTPDFVVTTLPAPPEFSQNVSRILLAGLLALLTFGCGRQKGDLEVGAAIEREIGGAESHSYRLPLDAGTYLSLRIEQPGIDVTARLDGPGRESVPVFDDRGTGANDNPDRLAWVSKDPGAYRLVVQARDPKAPRGLYRVELGDLRGTRPKDAERLAAAKVYNEGRLLLWERVEGKDLGAARLARFEKALQLWQKSGDPLGQVDALVQIAENYNGYGRPKDAVALGEKAVALAQSAEYRAGEARALQALGNAQNRLSEWPRAIESYQRSLGIWQELHDQGRQGTALYSLGSIYDDQGQFDQALEALRRARPLLIASGDDAVSVRPLVSIANIQGARGETAQALESCQKALELGRSAKEASAEALALHCLGAAYRQRGEWETARKLFEESLAINLRLNNLDYQASGHQALGSIYFNLGEPDRALSEYAQGLAICRAIGKQDLEARLLTNTGWIHQARGDRERALAYYRQALPLHEKLSYKSGIALTLYATGVAYTSLGKPRESLSFLHRALELREQIDERAGQAGILLEIGTAHKDLGDFRQAVDYFRRALDLSRKVESTNLEAESLFRFASLDILQGRLLEGLDKVKSSLAIIESIRGSVSSDKLRTSFFASKRAYYELYVDLLMRLEALHPGQYGTAALEASERARARGLLDLLAEGRINLQEGIAPELRQREIELGVRLSSLQDRLGKLPAGGGEAAALERQLERVPAEMEKLESRIRRQHQRYAEIRYPTPLSSPEIQSLLDDRTALVQYFTGKQGSYVFVVTQGSVDSYRLPPRETLAMEVKALRRLLQNRVGRRQLHRFQDLAAQLYAELLRPADSALRGKSRLLIAPDGPLYLLPFEVLLVDGESVRGRGFRELPYLLRRFAVSYLPSASVLKGLRTARSVSAGSRQASKRFLGFADPLYGSGSTPDNTPGNIPDGATRGSGPELVRLTESKEEVRRIATLYPASAVALFTGASATEENVKGSALLAEARQVHFATHGSLNESQPQLSGLELARTGASKEDGTLRVYEIFNLRLNADLLTLSACDTALGKEVRGEGIVGMTRAFFYAGARSLVVSLWPVSDRSTPDLMYDFYRDLGAARTKAEALRQAKLSMIDSESYADPYFWGPFILSGDPR